MGQGAGLKYRIPVRELCEFSAKTGDLDLRFTPAPTAQEGIAGHQMVASRRGDEYEAEVPLTLEMGPLTINGRADGYDPVANRLEEVKTHRGDLKRMPDNKRALHWAQVMAYGAMLCQARALPAVELRLVYFDIATGHETHLDRRCEAGELYAVLQDMCDRFSQWAAQEVSHRERRDGALSELRFPYADFRIGQRELAEAVYKAASLGCCLMVEAPTGIGKTLGTLFPQLKALASKGLDRLFFLAAKTPGRRLALDALARLRTAEDMPLRVLELASRDKSCEHPELACHGESCPLARGFYDRLPKARQAAAERGWLDRTTLREIALENAVCPYFLGQEMARWADVVVGDYNYYFDLGGMLHGLSVANAWRTLVLVDEAHNLVDRGRGMYSATLTRHALDEAKKQAPNAALKRGLTRVGKQWKVLIDAQESEYQRYAALPDKLLFALQQATSAITEHLAELPAPLAREVQQFYFDALHFTRIADLYGDDFIFDIAKHGAGPRESSTLCVRNLSPAAFLGPRFAQSHSSTLFSATLSPSRYYMDLLGLAQGTPWRDVASPFSADQLRIQLVSDVSTRYQHRSASISPIVALIARQYDSKQGNYLAFFSSFDYLEQVANELIERRPDLPVWRQARNMHETERDAFLARFVEGGRGIGFAVLGGAFGEGIDLPGDRLIGAFIATLGLPQFNPVNEQLRARMQHMFGAGYEYAYLYPGLQKVIQAAGRVVRTLEDSGIVILIDDRFGQRQIRELLPKWWPAPMRTQAHAPLQIAQR
jgi:Rad3-related DNA helicase